MSFLQIYLPYIILYNIIAVVLIQFYKLIKRRNKKKMAQLLCGEMRNLHFHPKDLQRAADVLRFSISLRPLKNRLILFLRYLH